MPRRNFLTILFVAAISFACYQVTDHNPYGRYFSDIMHKIDRMYYKSVDREKLFDTAVKGMVDSLDIHSEFMDRDEARKFLDAIDQRYGGIGIEINDDAEAKRIIVTDTLVGSPAYKASILAGDQILKIDDASADRLGFGAISERIRGQIGTPIRLTIQRPGESKPIEVALLRAEIKVDSVLGDTRNTDDSWNFHLAGHPEIAYIRIGGEGFRASGGFGDRTADELAAALATLDRHKLKGMIIDLRFNGGGRLDAAVNVCSEFIPKGQLVVTLKRRDGSRRGRRIVGRPRHIHRFSDCRARQLAERQRQRDRRRLLAGPSSSRGRRPAVVWQGNGAEGAAGRRKSECSQIDDRHLLAPQQ